MASVETTQPRAMKVTTVRFGADLWALLEGEAAHAGVSVSQYVREAALARAAFAAGARAGAPSALLAAWSETTLATELRGPEHAASTQRLIAALSRIASQDSRQDAAALRGETRQARRNAKQAQAARTGSAGPGG
jgi:hypothetical protein